MSTSPSVLPAGSSALTSELLEGYWNEEQLAAELDGCSVKTIRRWAEERSGPPVTKVGRKNYYRKVAVAAWLLSREESGRRRQRVGRKVAQP
jgi:helix-turn-helix protein